MVWNMVLSGMKVVIVPDSSESPIGATGASGFPFSYVCDHLRPCLITSTVILDDSALTQDTPTP